MSPVTWLLFCINQECSPIAIVRKQPDTIPVLNYHHTSRLWALDLYQSDACMHDVRAVKGPDRTKVDCGDILPRCWGELRPLLWFTYLYIHVQMHTDTKSYTALAAAFFPGEVITLWVDCMGLCSWRFFPSKRASQTILFSQVNVQFI